MSRFLRWIGLSAVIVAILFVAVWRVGNARAQMDASVGATETNVNVATTVATVDIQNASIVSRKGNAFVVSFDITNKIGIQPAVQYGVELTDAKNQSGSFIDQKSYDEVLNIGENAQIHKEISYEAPSALSGEYNLWLVSRNSNGFPLAIAFVSKVVLTGDAQGFLIQIPSCFLTVEGEKGLPHYTLAQGVDIAEKETLIGTCAIKNISPRTLTATPQFETYYRTVFGKKVGQQGGDTPSFTLKAGETKTLSVRLPKALQPQAYDVKFSLFSKETGISSNPAFFHYVLRGASATIQQITFDKDAYSVGETAHLSLYTTESADSFPESRAGTSTALQSAVLEALVTNGITAEKCGELVQQSLQSGFNRIGFSITKKCENPVASVTLTSNGTVLDEKDFKVVTASKVPEAAGQAVPPSIGTFSFIGVVILLVVGALLGFLIRRKKGPGALLAFLLLSAASFGVPHNAMAETITKSFWNIAFSSTVNLSKTTVSPGEFITVSGSLTSNVCSNAVDTNYMFMAGPDDSPSSPAEYPITLLNGAIVGTRTIQAPTTPGTYYIHVRSEFYPGLSKKEFIRHNIPFTVVAKPDITANLPTVSGTAPVPGKTDTFYTGSSVTLTANVANDNVRDIAETFQNKFLYTTLSGGSSDASANLPLSNIAKGTSKPVSVTIPNATEGTFDFTLRADTGNAVSESNDANDSLPVRVVIETPPTLLPVPTFTPPPITGAKPKVDFFISSTGDCKAKAKETEILKGAKATLCWEAKP